MSDGETTRTDNGAQHDRMQKIVLQFDPATFNLHIDLQAINLDCAKAMLDQAGRWVDAQLRMASAQRIVEQQRIAAEDAAIAARLRGGPRIV